VANQGQWSEQVWFKADLPGGALFVENATLTYSFYEDKLSQYVHPENTDPVSGNIWLHSYQVIFNNANSDLVQGQKLEPDYVNFYLGDDPEKWASKVPIYKRVRQSNIYQGIDMLLYDKMGSLKYDLIVAPQVDPNQISMEFNGVNNLQIKDGNLVIKTKVNEVIEKAPFAYQVIDGILVEVECDYVLTGNELRFLIGEYNSNYELTIDPELSFASYSGSNANNFGFTATDDSNGNLYAGSIAYNVGYPTTFGAFDADFNSGGQNVIDIAISKFSDDGSQLLFSTYLGGSSQEMPHSIIVNSQEELIVLGNTGSADFPHTLSAFDNSFNGGPSFNFIDVSFGNMLHNFGCDIFVCKFSADGTEVLGSTFVGGTGNDGLNFANMLSYNYGDVFRGEVIVDEEDNIIVASVTESTDFPVGDNPFQSDYSGGATDAVLFSLDPSLTTMRWSTYLGGSNDDSGYSVQLDDLGNIFLAGGTKSEFVFDSFESPDPDFNGVVDGFIAKFNADASILEGFSFVGTESYEQCYFVQLDNLGNVYVIGQSTGVMPVSLDQYNNAGGKQFIQKFDNNLQTLEWSTVFGTGGVDIDISPCAFLVSDCDQIYVSGWGGGSNNAHSPFISTSTTQGMPITDDAFQSNSDGSDFYLLVLSPDAEDIVYATFFGGGSSSEHVDGGTSKFDKNGSVYQAVCAGCGGNDDFPTTAGAWSQENNSSCNLGVFKFDLAKITAVIDLNGPDVICEGQEMQFENNSNGGENFIWHFGDNEQVAGVNSPTHTYESAGFFDVTLVVTDDNDCVQPDSATVTIEVLAGINPEVLDYGPICNGDALILQGLGSANAYWSTHPSLTVLEDLEAEVNPSSNTTYYFVDWNDCETDSIPVAVQIVQNEFEISDDESICVGTSIEISASGGETYFWYPEEWFDDPESATTNASPLETTTVFVDIISIEGCEHTDSLFITVLNDSPGGEIYDPVFACYETSVQLSAETGLSWSWSPEEYLNDPTLQNPQATVQENTVFTVDISNACGFGSSEVLVEVLIPEAFAIEDQEICLGEEIQLWADGGVEFAWSPRFGLNDSTVMNPFASPPITTTYTVYVTNIAGCVDSEEVEVVVHPLPEVDAGESQEMIWYESVILNGFAEGQYFWSPKDDVSCFNCLSTEAFPANSSWFILEAMNEFGCKNTDSVFVEVLGPLFVPNSFSPNDDGRNDVFLPISIGLKKYELQIYDRWGIKIFETKSLSEAWNGRYKGKDSPVDVYVWKIIYTDPKHGDKMITGHVSLIR